MLVGEGPAVARLEPRPVIIAHLTDLAVAAEHGLNVEGQAVEELVHVVPLGAPGVHMPLKVDEADALTPRLTPAHDLYRDGAVPLELAANELAQLGQRYLAVQVLEDDGNEVAGGLVPLLLVVEQRPVSAARRAAAAAALAPRAAASLAAPFALVGAGRATCRLVVGARHLGRPFTRCWIAVMAVVRDT